MFPCFLKHDKNMDVCYEVTSLIYEIDDLEKGSGICMWVDFWNLGQSGKSFDLNVDGEKIFIPFKEFENWKGLECNKIEPNLRNAPWTPLAELNPLK